MDIPTTRKLSDAERFVAGLELLAKECNMTAIKYTQLGVISYSFADGTTVGGNAAWHCAGLI